MKAFTEGGRRVAEIVAKVGAAEFGRRVRTTEGMARHLATGRKTPGGALKERIRDVWGVAVETWDQQAEAAPPKKPASGGAPRPSTTSSRLSGVEELRATIALYDDRIAEAQADEFTTASSWVALLRGKADACDKLAKLQGEGELTTAMVVRSRAWRELLARLEPILARHPDVARQMAEALEAVDG